MSRINPTSVYLDPDLEDELKLIARKNKRRLSPQIVVALEGFVRRQRQRLTYGAPDGSPNSLELRKTRYDGQRSRRDNLQEEARLHLQPPSRQAPAHSRRKGHAGAVR